MFEILEDLDEKMVLEADGYRAKKTIAWKRWAAVAACAVIAVRAIASMPKMGSSSFVKEDESPAEPKARMDKAEAYANEGEYGMRTINGPRQTAGAEEMTAEAFYESGEHWEWWDSYVDSLPASRAVSRELDGYYSRIMEKVLLSDEDNTVCSPLNTYFAFSMLAGVTDGNTRQQVLDMLGAASEEEVYSNVEALWAANSIDNPVLKSRLANSMWLRDDISYDEGTLNKVSENCHASDFIGRPGSAEMDRALQEWTDENTGRLLTDYVKDLKLEKETVLSLISTLYYKASWIDRFNRNATDTQIFHGKKGDTEVDMMHTGLMTQLRKTKNFRMIGLDLTDSGQMCLFLPNKGVDVDKLAGDPLVLRAIRGGAGVDYSRPMVHLSVPRFEVTSKCDLRPVLQELGVTDVMIPGIADFTPLTGDVDEIYLSRAEHAALVKIDEEGVTGAAYTEMSMAAGARMPQEEIDLVFDRPFMFVITGRDGSVLFSGIVRNIE